MIIVSFLLFFHISTIYCEILSNCSFLKQTYLSNLAVYNQIQFHNQTSIILTASYSFSTNSIFEFGLIYQFSSLNSFVPFPIIFNCEEFVQTCQLKTITTSKDSESIHVQLTKFNYTKKLTSTIFNQMGLYLKQGRYQLSNCSFNNGQQITNSQTIFYIEIQYEKTVGSSCNAIYDTCGSSLLTNCSSSICTCLSSKSSLVSYSNSYYCADMMNNSNCQIFPSRCITWCNQTKNSLCICPIDTLKIQRNNFFICELSVNSNNCSINNDDNNIRRCPLGQCCFNKQCIDCSMIATTSKIINSNDSLDESLRIALGVIAGLLGTSVLILLSGFCWLRQRQKRHRIAAEKSLTNSSTSSLYITPIQQPQQIQFPSSISFISQYRTDSFRQAVSSGNKQNQIIERVSIKRDSYIYEKNGWSSPTFSTLDFIIPTHNEQIEKNIYQIIRPSTPILTHSV